jgi:hypothetical protein
MPIQTTPPAITVRDMGCGRRPPASRHFPDFSGYLQLIICTNRGTQEEVEVETHVQPVLSLGTLCGV